MYSAPMSDDQFRPALTGHHDDNMQLHDAPAQPAPPPANTGADLVVGGSESELPRSGRNSASEWLPHPIEPSFADLLGRAVADKLEKDPSLLHVPLENIGRWLTDGVLSTPGWFVRWRELLESAQSDAVALRRVLELLRSDTEEARRWRDFSPFAGVLSSAERRQIIRQCSYSH